MTDIDDEYLNGVLPWRVEERGELLRTPIFSIKQRRASSQVHAKKQCDFVYMDSVDWVNVLAITPQGLVVMIEQFRHGRGEVTLEIPGGMVDPGEDPVQAGVRELSEETGYGGGQAIKLGAVSPNPALQNNLLHVVWVPQAELVRAPHLDHNEEIAVRLVHLDAVPGLIQRGVINHALVVAAFHHLSLRKG